MLVNALLPAFNPVMLRRGCSSFKRRYARTDTRGSVRRASGFVLTSKTEVTDVVNRWDEKVDPRSRMALS
jgi:hypothetical protein